MMKFIYPRLLPPGGFRFLVEKTGMEISHETMKGLVYKVGEHMISNNIDVPPNLADIIEDYICHNAPPGFCRGDPGDTPVRKYTSLMDIRSNTLALYKRAGGGTTPGEIQKRIDMCAKCSHNDRRLCTSCTGLQQWALRLVGNPQRKPKDEWLGVCAIDCCSILAKVHFKTVANKEAPAECWMSGE